jgi:hypothetical protein
MSAETWINRVKREVQGLVEGAHRSRTVVTLKLGS